MGAEEENIEGEEEKLVRYEEKSERRERTH